MKNTDDRSVNRIVYAEEKNEDRVIIEEVFADRNLATIVHTVQDGEQCNPHAGEMGAAFLTRSKSDATFNE